MRLRWTAESTPPDAEMAKPWEWRLACPETGLDLGLRHVIFADDETGEIWRFEEGPNGRLIESMEPPHVFNVLKERWHFRLERRPVGVV